MKRVVIPELLDSDSGTTAEVTASLKDLRDFNRFLGGVGLTAELIADVAAKASLRTLTLLDIAGGEGYVLSRVIRQLSRQGVQATGTILDRASTHMRPAEHGLRGVCGDALALPFRDNAFDVVTSNLFVHHLEPPEVARFLREAVRVARYAVVANDLERNWIHLRCAELGKLIYRSRITRNDAPASVLRAYTAAEFEAMVRPLGLRFKIAQSFFYRLGICIWKNA